MSNHKLPVPEWLTAEYLEGYVRNHWKKPEAVIREIKVTPGSKFGDNYACQILRIQLTIDSGDETEELSIIAKVKPNTEVSDIDFDLFGVEVLFFEILNPDYQKIVVGIPTAKKFSPDCFGIDREKKTILMEDLLQKKMIMQSRGQLLSKEQAFLTVNALATLHGASLHLLKKDPSLKEKFNKSIWHQPGEVFMKQFNNFKVFMDGNAESFGLSEDRSAKLRALGTSIIKEQIKNIYDLNENCLNVMLHGDLWMNNMMYHFSDDVPDQVILLDYQITNYNCFALDLNYFLFSSVQSEVIVDNLDAILEAYYKKLVEVAPADALKDVTLDRIKREFYERNYFGLIMGLVFRGCIVQEIPVDLDKVLEGVTDDGCFRNPMFIADVQKLVPLYEKIGVF